MRVSIKHSFVTTLIAALVVLNLLLVYVLVSSAGADRQQVAAALRDKAQILAEVIDRGISGEVSRIDAGLRGIAADLEQDLGGAEPHRQRDLALGRGRAVLGEALALAVLDADGRSLASASAPKSAHRPAAASGLSDPALTVSGPVIEPATGQRVMRLSRPYRTPDGKIGGSVEASLPIAAVVGAWAGIDLGVDGRFLLRDAAGTPIMREPPAMRSDQDAVSTDAGSGADRAETDGVERVYVERPLRALPLRLAVGLALDEHLGPWREQVRRRALLGGLFLLVTLLAAGLIWAQFRRAEESRDLLRTLMSTIPDLIWLKDPKGVYIACNPRFEAFFGKRETEIVGRDDYAFMEPDLAEFFRGHDRLAVEADGPHRNEEWLTFAADGYRGLFETIKTPMKTAQGRLIGVLGIARDISHQREALESLREERQLRATIMESIPGVCYALDRDGKLMYWNQTLERILGYPPETLRERSALDFFAAEDRGLIGERIAAAFAAEDAERAVEAEAVLLCASGCGLPFHLTSRRIDMGGQPALVGVGFDVSARKEAEDALRRLNAELEERVLQRTADLQSTHAKLLDTQFAMDSVGIGITWADFGTGRFIHANRFSAEFLGYSLDELLAMRVCDIDPNFPPEVFGPTVEEIRRRGYVQFETEQMTKDGRLRPVEMTIYYHEASDGTAPRLIAFMSDIAKRKESEAALREAKEASEAANAAKSEFLANMSHEIRTPLNAILGLTYLLRKEGVSPAQSERLDKMEIAGRHLLSLINDILDLSKIEAGRMDLEHNNFHLSAVLDNVASIIRDGATSKGLTLEVDADGVPLWLWGDVTRLRQALLNFASNAVKFTERGRICLRSWLLEEQEEDLLVRFEVEDSGIGLTPEQQERLFHAFEQADGATSRKFGGTGLGLALTKRLVELMDGTVGLDSTPGVGSTFWFVVPLQRGHGPMPVLPTATTLTGAERLLRERHCGARVLLAEDNAINVEIVLEMLHGVGIDVAVAENGREAVDQARHQTFDIIFMDMQMPELGGIEATRIIRTFPQWAERPIIALTANAFAEDRLACLSAGMNDMLTKPVEPSLLYATLLHWLAPKARGERAPAHAEAVPRAGEDDEDHLLERLRAARGIDVDRGLAMLSGRAPKYLSLLRQLVDTQSVQMLELEQVLNVGDLTAARRMAHSLKGAAGALHLMAIADAAARVEQMLTIEQGLAARLETIQAGVEAVMLELRRLESILAPARQPH